MIIQEYKVRVTHIPFNVSFAHTTKSRASVQGIVLELMGENGLIGYGEVLPRDYVTGETNESVINHLINHVLPRLKTIKFDNFDHLITWLDQFNQVIPEVKANELCVKTIIELALLDLFAKGYRLPLIKLLGGSKRNVLEYTGVVTAGSSQAVEVYLEAYQAIGIKQYKLKVGVDLEQDIKNLKLIRSFCGDDAEIRVDANEAWDLQEAKEVLPQMAALGVASCEQPMPAKQQASYPNLVNFLNGDMKICIDESLCSREDALWFAQHKGADIFNLRVSKNGGILNAIELSKIAREHGILCQLGAQVGETTLLTRAGQILASCLGDLIYHEGAYGISLLQQDLTEHSVMFGNNGLCDLSELNNLTGLGARVSVNALNAITTEVFASQPS